MAMSLRLLKADSDYMPNWIGRVSPETTESISLSELKENDYYIYQSSDGDIVHFFFHAAAAASRSTGSSCEPYIDELDRVLSLLHRNWASTYYRSLQKDSCANWNSNVLTLVYPRGEYLYVEEISKTNG